MELVVKRITTIKFEVNNRGGDGTGRRGIKVRPDTAKLTNMVPVIMEKLSQNSYVGHQYNSLRADCIRTAQPTVQCTQYASCF